MTCFITAELVEGWHGFGSEVHYNDLQNYTLGHDFPKYDGQTGEIHDMAFTDRYKVSFLTGVYKGRDGRGDADGRWAFNEKRRRGRVGCSYS